jgi:hypothetical protein
MNDHFFSRPHTDIWGFAASMACAVHCGMLPFVLTMASMSGLRWLSQPWIEVGFILLSFSIAVIAIGKNFGRHKHILLAIKVVSAGFALILLAHIIGGLAEYVIAAAGGATIASGHILNWRLARKSECCQHH